MGFNAEEVAYMRSQRLARIATVDQDGQPDVVPVGFEYDGTYITIGGFKPANTRRHRNVGDGNTRVALVIDDLAATEPWSPRLAASCAVVTCDASSWTIKSATSAA